VATMPRMRSVLAVVMRRILTAVGQRRIVYVTRRSHNFAPFIRQTGERKAQTCAKGILRQASSRIATQKTSQYGQGVQSHNESPTSSRLLRFRISLRYDSAFEARSWLVDRPYQQLELEAQAKLDCSGIIGLAAEHAERRRVLHAECGVVEHKVVEGVQKVGREKKCNPFCHLCALGQG
jgi:hypothetical protein